MPDDIELAETDPYRPDATAEERADHLIGALLADENPVRRYRAVQALQAGRLRDVQAITLRELEIQHGSAAAAADAVGISRQSAGELLTKADAPPARTMRDLSAYGYGAYLAVVNAIAWSLPAGHQRERALRRWYTLEERAPQTLTMLPAVEQEADRWFKSLQASRRTVAQARRRELDEAAAAIAEWAMERKADPRLTHEEQFAVYVGLSATRKQYRERMTS